MKLFLKIHRKLNSVLSVSIVIPIISTLAFLVFIWLTIEFLTLNNLKINSASDYGNLLAGIFAFISVLFIAFTIKHQVDTTKLSRFEDHFFQLLKIQRENSQAISTNKKFGNNGFEFMLKEFKETLEIVRDFNFEYKTNSSSEPVSAKTKKHLDVNLSYLAFFYGIRTNKNDQIFSKCVSKNACYNQIDSEDLIKKLSSPNNSVSSPFLEGHQEILGPYFRHLFQSIKFINNQKSTFLSYKEKSKYVNLFRAQISTQEQMLFFFDSISELGSVWELSLPKKDINNHLITKYNLFTNIADSKIDEEEIRSYYPDIVLDREKKCIFDIINYDKKNQKQNRLTEKRKKLEKKYI